MKFIAEDRQCVLTKKWICRIVQSSYNYVKYVRADFTNRLLSLMIKKQNIYEQVIEHLHEYILANELRSGDRLPTETELAEHFGVGRQSIREAIKVLESVGVVETRPRDGSRLKQLNIGPLSEHLRFMFELEGVTLREMGASRSIIECAALPMVIENADEADFARLAGAIEDARSSISRGDDTQYVLADMEFHQALLAATKNRVLQGFGSILHEFFLQLKDRMASTKEALYRSIDDHERIYQALKSRDVETAQRVMDWHLSVYQGFGATPRSAVPTNGSRRGNPEESDALEAETLATAQ